MNNQTDDDVPTSSQSEKDILASCVGLMGMVYEDMLDYMDWAGFEYSKNPDDEGYPLRNYTYFEIVQRLFLDKTMHSGGTSTRKKIQELGIKEEHVCFKPNEVNEE